MTTIPVRRLCWGALLLGALALATPSAAQRGRGAARGSVHGANVSHNANVNRNANVNVNRNANVNVHQNVVVHDYGYDRWGHPVAAAAAVAATAFAIGAVVASLPPHCTATVVGNVTYQNCGGTYFQPVYQGTTVQYVVVTPPQ